MSKQLILIVDDEQDIQELTKLILVQEGFMVSSASTADQTIEMVSSQKPDLILLDLKLPGISGLEICRILKNDQKTSSIPVIMLTGKYIKPEERAHGLDMGADDYIIKPYSAKELTARIRAVLRRIDKEDEKEEELSTSDDSIVINIATHSVIVTESNGSQSKKVLSLTPKEFGLLWTFFKKKNHVLDRNFLCETVWGYEYYGTTRTVDVHIAHLREKLGEYGKRIETVEALGYKFVD